MRRVASLGSSAFTALICFGIGFIIAAGLSRRQVDVAKEKSSVADQIMDGMVQQKVKNFALYREIRTLQGQLTAEEKAARKLVAPVRPRVQPTRFVTSAIRLARPTKRAPDRPRLDQTIAHYASTGKPSSLGRHASLAASAIAPIASGRTLSGVMTLRRSIEIRPEVKISKNVEIKIETPITVTEGLSADQMEAIKTKAVEDAAKSFRFNFVDPQQIARARQQGLLALDAWRQSQKKAVQDSSKQKKVKGLSGDQRPPNEPR